MTPFFGLAPMLRFIRDTLAGDHRLSVLIEQFGQDAVDEAFALTLIERQRWRGRQTEFIDLTHIGEHVLNGIARAELVNKVQQL